MVNNLRFKKGEKLWSLKNWDLNHLEPDEVTVKDFFVISFLPKEFSIHDSNIIEQDDYYSRDNSDSDTKKAAMELPVTKLYYVIKTSAGEELNVPEIMLWREKELLEDMIKIWKARPETLPIFPVNFGYGPRDTYCTYVPTKDGGLFLHSRDNTSWSPVYDYTPISGNPIYCSYCDFLGNLVKLTLENGTELKLFAKRVICTEDEYKVYLVGYDTYSKRDEMIDLEFVLTYKLTPDIKNSDIVTQDLLFSTQTPEVSVILILGGEGQLYDFNAEELHGLAEYATCAKDTHYEKRKLPVHNIKWTLSNIAAREGSKRVFNPVHQMTEEEWQRKYRSESIYNILTYKTEPKEMRLSELIKLIQGSDALG